MQLDFLDGLFLPHRRGQKETLLSVGTRLIALEFSRNSRARNYILRLTADGRARVTIPWGGSKSDALEFAKSKSTWLAGQLGRLSRHPRTKPYGPGTQILLRGEWVQLEVGVAGGKQFVRFAEVELALANGVHELRQVVENYLRNLACAEIPPLVIERARLHNIPIKQVQIRNQRSRWGSCSSRGTISLNWRLIQIPEFVRDYLIVHELMHVREMNHSARYWAHVADAIPAYKEAERWLKKNSVFVR